MGDLEEANDKIISLEDQLKSSNQRALDLLQQLEDADKEINEL